MREKILRSDQGRIIEQTKFTYSLQEKLWKNKSNGKSGKNKQVEAFKVLKPVERQQRPKSINNFIYNFQQVSTIRSFGDDICECKIQ